MDNTHIVGVDIAKHKFDLALIINGKVKNKVFDNTPDGFNALIGWLTQHHVTHLHAGMEATGIYWDALATFLADRGHQVSVVNPAQIAAYGKSVLPGGKTDVQGARLIARFCERERPVAWQPAPPAQRELLQWVRQLQQLNEWHQAEQNRLATGSGGVAQESLAASVAFIAEQIKLLEVQINQHIDNNPTLKHPRELLDSIPGVGDKTAPWLLADLGTGERFARGK